MSADASLSWQDPVGEVVTAHLDIGDQLRRRRQGAGRLEPLPSGYRDPLDDLPPMDDRQVRELCNRLAKLGWDVDYLERRYGIRRSA